MIIFFPEPLYCLKGKIKGKGEYHYYRAKNPVQVTRERTVLTQYDREGFEVPRFQNSHLPVTTEEIHTIRGSEEGVGCRQF